MKSLEARPIAEAVNAVAKFLVADQPLGTTLDRIAHLARTAIESAAAVGITLLDEKQRPTTSVATDPISTTVDQAQYDEGDGPCLTAYRERRVIRVDDTRAVAATWPTFSRQASRVGVLTTLSLPLTAGDRTFGAFNLYATEANAISVENEDDAQLFATQAAVVLANASAYWAVADLAAGLRTAMASRAAIEQAKGILIASRHCTPDEAFRMLIEASQRHNVKVRDIAARIVASEQAARRATDDGGTTLPNRA